MLAQVEALVARDQAFDPATAVRTFRFGLPDSMEVLIMPALLARMREVAPGIHLRLYNFDASRLFDDLDADEMDLAIGYGELQQGQIHHKRRKLLTETYLCMFNAEKTGIVPPISLDDFVRLPHVLTSLRPDRSVRGIVDEALDKLGFPHGPVFGAARTFHRHHAGATGPPVRRRIRAQPQPASGGIE